MSIVGIGTDIVSLSRIEKLFKRFDDKFAKRILTPQEQAILSTQSAPVSYLAKRFAAKEAVSKALGTGIGVHLAFNEISVINLDNGKPIVQFIGKSKDYVDALSLKAVHISLSDEQEYALAFVVIEK